MSLFTQEPLLVQETLRKETLRKARVLVPERGTHWRVGVLCLQGGQSNRDTSPFRVIFRHVNNNIATSYGTEGYGLSCPVGWLNSVTFEQVMCELVPNGCVVVQAGAGRSRQMEQPATDSAFCCSSGGSYSEKFIATGVRLSSVFLQSHSWHLKKDSLFLCRPGILGSSPHPLHAYNLSGQRKACRERWCGTEPQSDEEVGQRLSCVHPHPLTRVSLWSSSKELPVLCSAHSAG